MRLLDRILELVVRNSAPLPSVAEIFFLTLPAAFTYTLPMGVLVGILIGLSRLAADSEITGYAGLRHRFGQVSSHYQHIHGRGVGARGGQ